MQHAGDNERARADARTNLPSNVIALHPRQAAAIPDAPHDPLVEGQFVDQIDAIARQWAAARRHPAPTPKPKRQAPAGIPLDRTLERTRTLVELAEAWGVDLRLALAMSNRTAGTDQPAATVPLDAPNVVPFPVATVEARP